MSEPEIVWLFEERTYAYLVMMGAYYSHVQYRRGDETVNLLVENDEFEVWKDYAIEYESE